MSLSKPESPVLDSLKDSVSGLAATVALKQVAAAIREAGTLLITAHTQPDGDALGSDVALALALEALGKTARVVASEPSPEKYAGLLPGGRVTQVGSSQEAAALGPVDLCVLLDTSEPERCGIFQEVFFAPGQRSVCLDHHLCQPPVPFHAHLILPEAPATGSLVLALIDELGVPLTPEIAQALWIALATDTGWFRFPNATAWAFRDAARLVEMGISLEQLYDRIYLSHSPGRARLQGVALSSLRLGLDGRFAWTSLSTADREAAGVSLEELDGMVDGLKSVRGAEVMVLMVEVGPGQYKLSLRARGRANVEPIARHFGGGGHAKAAGCRFSGSLDELERQLLPLVESELA